MSKSRKQMPKKQVEQQFEPQVQISKIDNTELIKAQQKYVKLQYLFSRFLSDQSLDNIPHTELGKGVWAINNENVMRLNSEQSQQKEIENVMADN